jgi:nucleotide-binding universal stress UspA family protein
LTERKVVGATMANMAVGGAAACGRRSRHGAGATTGDKLMHPVRRVLVATDFSSGSAAAVARGVRIARLHGARLDLVHAFDVGAWQALRRLFDLGHLAGERSTEVLLRERLQALADELAAREGVAVDSHFGLGAPAAVIEARARAMNAALLVIARRSEPAAPGASGTLLRMLRSAACPVLVIRAAPLADYGRVLCAVDLRERSRHAAALSLAMFPHALHLLLHVIDPQWEREVRGGHAEPAPLGELIASLHGLATQRLQDLAGELAAAAGPQAQVEAVVVEAIPAMGIVQHAATWPADCVVVGRHGQGLAADKLLGSTALDAIHHSGRDVLVVP